MVWPPVAGVVRELVSSARESPSCQPALPHVFAPNRVKPLAEIQPGLCAVGCTLSIIASNI